MSPPALFRVPSPPLKQPFIAHVMLCVMFPYFFVENFGTFSEHAMHLLDMYLLGVTDRSRGAPAPSRGPLPATPTSWCGRLLCASAPPVPRCRQWSIFGCGSVEAALNSFCFLDAIRVPVPLRSVLLPRVHTFQAVFIPTCVVVCGVVGGGLGRTVLVATAYQGIC